MRKIFLIVSSILMLTESFSQVQQDSVFYENNSDRLITRLYTSRKYTSFLLHDQLSEQSFRFEPNSTLNLGVGATYDDFTLNLAYGFGFMNPELGTGKTKYLDLQAHMYPTKFVIDFFGQFYTGFYLLQDLRDNKNEIFVQPDMSVRMLGLNVQYLLNGEQLSLKAAFLQSAWQKKSAGSLVFGVEGYASKVSNDGLILPLSSEISETRNFNRLISFDFGPNLGYVHTVVIAKHFFVTGMISTNLSVNRVSLNLEDGPKVAWDLSPNLFWRGFIGYNSRVWSINANYVENRVRNGVVNDMESTFLVGNYRINLIYRLIPGSKLRSRLDFVSPRKILQSWKK